MFPSNLPYSNEVLTWGPEIAGRRHLFSWWICCEGATCPETKTYINIFISKYVMKLKNCHHAMLSYYLRVDEQSVAKSVGVDTYIYIILYITRTGILLSQNLSSRLIPCWKKDWHIIKSEFLITRFVVISLVYILNTKYRCTLIIF